MGASSIFSLQGAGVRDASRQEETPEPSMRAVIQWRDKNKSPVPQGTLAYGGDEHRQWEVMPMGWGITPRRGKPAGFIIEPPFVLAAPS